MKLTEEDILSLGWESIGQLEYKLGAWELETFNNVVWRINTDDSAQLMWFAIDSKDTLKSLMLLIGIPLNIGYGMYEVQASFGEPNGQGEPLYYYLTFQGEDKKIDTPIYRFMANSLEEARSMVDLDQVEYVKWSGPDPKIATEEWFKKAAQYSFEDLKFTIKESEYMTRHYARIYFPNGYGVSVINLVHHDEIMSKYRPKPFEENYEIAVLKGNAEDADLCYDTPITDDVIQGLTPTEVTEYLNKIAQLPSYESTNNN